MSELARPVPGRVAVRPHVVLALSLVVAMLGVFPYNTLFLVPLAASLTLAGLDARVRAVSAGLSGAALILGMAQLAGIG